MMEHSRRPQLEFAEVPKTVLNIVLNTVLNSACIFLNACLVAVALTGVAPMLGAAEPLAEGYEKHARALIQQYCVDCHGAEKPDGNVRLDEEQGVEQLLANKQLWWRVLKNVRAELMPPSSAELPAAGDRRKLVHWIETAVAGVDPQNPDPGPSSLRRLNRTEYRQTIRELMGIDFNAEIVFPPDDTGFGF